MDRASCGTRPLLVGLTMDRDELARADRRAGRRDGRGGRGRRGRARADAAGASRTARAALGFEELLARATLEAVKARPARLRARASSPGCGGWRASTLIDRTGARRRRGRRARSSRSLAE